MTGPPKFERTASSSTHTNSPPATEVNKPNVPVRRGGLFERGKDLAVQIVSAIVIGLIAIASILSWLRSTETVRTNCGPIPCVCEITTYVDMFSTHQCVTLSGVAIP